MATITIPASAFATPSADEKAQNSDYWNGYAMGQENAGLVPSPAGAANFEAYIQGSVWPLYKPQTTGMPPVFPNNYNVGYDNALADAANWLWLNDPNSPHNKAS